MCRLDRAFTVPNMTLGDEAQGQVSHKTKDVGVPQWHDSEVA